MDIHSGYRAGMFDGEAELSWLRQGWRGLRLYGRTAKAAIAAGDMVQKAEMISRADFLLSLLCGILDTDSGATLGPALLTIYTALRHTLLLANSSNDTVALDDFENALAILDRDMIEPETTMSTA